MSGKLMRFAGVALCALALVLAGCGNSCGSGGCSRVSSTCTTSTCSSKVVSN